MTPEAFSILCTPEVREAIHLSRGRDPLAVAMDRRVPHAREVATQLKYLARAATKLPTYAEAECILPPRAFEQASSEATARHKALEGDSVLDLTCGLGVDAYFLSQRFRRVVTLERDALLAQVARENFSRLGVRNIEVVNTSAEEYLSEEGLSFDWVYADPDRRSAEGRKLVRLEACSPNVLALRERIAKAAPRLCLKNSPLFDVEEAHRLFPKARVEVLSLGDECKEVLLYDEGTTPSLRATALGRGSFSAPLHIAPPPLPASFEAEAYRYLILPDVALQKARLVRQHLAPWGDVWSENGFGFARQEPTGVLGRYLPIERIEPFDAKALRRALKGCGVELFKRDFPLSLEEIYKRLGAKAGGAHRLALTRIEGRSWCIFLAE